MDLLLDTLWQGRVFRTRILPQLLKQGVVKTEHQQTLAYLMAYHEVTAANLLQVASFSVEVAAGLAEDAVLDLLDYALATILDLISQYAKKKISIHCRRGEEDGDFNQFAQSAQESAQQLMKQTPDGVRRLFNFI